MESRRASSTPATTNSAPRGSAGYAALQRKEQFVEELQLVRKDGSRIWARLTAAAMNRADPLKGTLGIYEDVTEERNAAQALRDALERQERIFSASPHGIATLERRRFVVTSPAFERMFGYGPGELVGKSVRVIQPSEAEFERVGRVTYEALLPGDAVDVQEEE